MALQNFLFFVALSNTCFIFFFFSLGHITPPPAIIPPSIHTISSNWWLLPFSFFPSICLMSVKFSEPSFLIYPINSSCLFLSVVVVLISLQMSLLLMYFKMCCLWYESALLHSSKCWLVYNYWIPSWWQLCHETSTKSIRQNYCSIFISHDMHCI